MEELFKREMNCQRSNDFSVSRVFKNQPDVTKNLPANVRDTDSILGSQRSKRKWSRKWQPTSVFSTYLENTVDTGGWWAIVHAVSKNWT